jgi:hypothetical protein
MEFLILRGHSRLIPQGGLAEFPDAILNGKRLDLYNLYKEVSQWNCVCGELLWMIFCVDLFLNLLVFLGGYKGRISRWQWHQLEGTNLFKNGKLHINK